MFDKKKLKLGFRIIFTLGLLFYLAYLTPMSLSKYTKEAISTAKVGLAIYLLNADYYTTNLKLMDLTPRTDPYIYTFKIANFKDSTHADTSLTYDLGIKTTTNMPITYQLYMNYDTNNSIITSDTTAADDDGTYFRTFKTAQETMLYNENKENIYTLYVYFPVSYNSSDYQDLVEYIEINVDSKQLMNS